MRLFKATSQVSVMSRRLRRSFEKDEEVPESELEMIVAHFRKCFEPVPEPVPDAAPAASGEAPPK